MSRLAFKEGSVVTTLDGAIRRVVRVFPGEANPYMLDDNDMYSEHVLQSYTPPAPEWEEVEGFIKDKMIELRERFANIDWHHMHVEIVVAGNTHGDLKIEYRVSEGTYDRKAEGFSLEPVVDEIVRRHTWDKRNAPLAIGYDGTEKHDD